MPTSSRSRPAPFGEKEFYLDEFRGRSVVLALAPALATSRTPLTPLAVTMAELLRNRTRVVLWWPTPSSGVSPRLETLLDGIHRRTRGRRGQVLTLGSDVVGGPPAGAQVRAALWRCLRRSGVAAVVGGGDGAFPSVPLDLAATLGVSKVVLLDATGGLTAGRAPLSFVDENQLATLLHGGQAEWAGLGERRELLTAVRRALGTGIEAVNLCTVRGLADELFTYAGSGTLFTEGDYCRIDRLSLDTFSQAERLLERGQRERVLARRTPDQLAGVLANGFGALVSGRHLAGVGALLTAPYERERAGEIVALYTITRFKGEGIGDRLVGRLLAEAADAALDYVFACAVDAGAQRFFDQRGFRRMPATAVPPAKWVGYDRRRRGRVVCFRRTPA